MVVLQGPCSADCSVLLVGRRVLPAGIEYLVQDAQEPHLFVIRRQYRSPAKAISPQAFYYILDGTVYQSPSLHGALSARLVRV